MFWTFEVSERKGQAEGLGLEVRHCWTLCCPPGPVCKAVCRAVVHDVPLEAKSLLSGLVFTVGRFQGNYSQNDICSPSHWLQTCSCYHKKSEFLELYVPSLVFTKPLRFISPGLKESQFYAHGVAVEILEWSLLGLLVIITNSLIGYYCHAYNSTI